MRTVAVDFDGVIHRYSQGWQDGSIYDPPVAGAFDALRALRQRFDVVIYTTRAGETEPYRSLLGSGAGVRAAGIVRIQEWFRQHGGEDLADLHITDRKPLAVAFIDDRAVRFTSWSQAIADLGQLEAEELL